MTLILYHCPDWASQVIRLALEEIGQPYQIRPMDWDAGDFDAPGFRAVNPQGLIPAIETPEGPIFETAAILLWLNARHGGLGPRMEDPGAAAFLSWLFFTANTIHPTVMALIHPDRLAGPEAATEVARLALERLVVQAGHLERFLATEAPPWLSPRQPALGHYLGILLRWAAYLPEDAALRFSLDPFPRLQAILAAHEMTPAALRLARIDGLGATPYTAPEAA